MVDSKTECRADEITLSAIHLFNRDGVANVRSRDISDYLGISNGNLTYHFPTMASLVEAAVGRLIEAGAAINPVDKTGPISVPAYFHIIQNFVGIQQEYSFFFKDILELIRRYHSVAKMHADMIAARIVHGRALIASMERDGTVKAEPAPGVYDRLQITMLTNAIFWMTTKELTEDLDTAPFEPERLLLDVLLPHLTAKGSQQYNELFSI